MKTFISLMTAICLLLSLVGCGGSVSPNASQLQPKPSAPTSKFPEVSSACPVGVLESRIDLLKKNLNTPVQSPRLSWQSSAEIKQQAYYRVVLFESALALSEDIRCYDSGWIESSLQTNVHLDYELATSKLYYYIVYVQDSNGLCYRSEPAYFLTELGDSWVSAQLVWTGTQENKHNVMVAPLETPSENIDKLVLHATGIGNETTRQQLFDIFIGDTYVGCGPTRETTKDDKTTIFYQSWDITEYCKDDSGVLTFVNYAEDATKGILFQVNAYYKDGGVETVLNSAEDAAVLRAYDTSNMYFGDIGTGYFPTEAENFDTRILKTGWDMSSQDISSWGGVMASPLPKGYQITPYPSENTYRYQVKPEKIKKIAENHYIIDFGKEVIGSFAIHAQGTKDSLISIYLGEELKEDGSVMYQMRTANNYALQWYAATGSICLEGLNVMGFRYVELIDCPFEATEDTVFAYALRQSFDEQQAGFDSSHELLNDIYSFIHHSIKTTNQSILVDSQTRERAPYEGDAYINSLASYAVSNNYSLPRFSQQWLIENRTWPLEYVYLSSVMMWQDFLNTGDSKYMEQYYDLLISRDAERTLYLDCLKRRVGLIKNPYEGSGWDSVLVDWPETERENFDYCQYNTVANAFAYAAFDSLDKIATALGRTDKDWAGYRDKIGQAMITYLYDEEVGAFSDGANARLIQSDSHTYHSTVYVMWSGAIDDNPEILDACKKYLSGMQSNCFSVYGSFYLFDVLYRYGMDEQAFSMLTATDDIRSYYHLIYELGATITPEAWDPSIKDNMTYSHAWSSGAMSAIVSGLVGITPSRPGFVEFELAPQLGELENLSIQYPTVRGTVSVSYEISDNNCEFHITVPGNTVCTFRVPAGWVLSQENASSDTAPDSVSLNSGSHELLLCKSK